MKKQLLGTTTLFAVGLLVAGGSGQVAYAAEPMSVSVGGFFSVGVQVQDEEDDVGDPARGLQGKGVVTDGEVQFTASTELDNGIEIKARIEYEAGNYFGGASTSLADERWLRFSGGFGQLKIGHDDNAAYVMYYQAPVGAYQLGIQTPTFGVPAMGGNAITSYTSLYPGLGSDGNKIIYFTPRVNGFQLGLSYQPDGSRSASDAPALTPADNGIGAQEDIIAVGVNYVSSFDEIDVAISFGYIHGNLERQNPGTVNINVTTTTISGSVIGIFGTTTTVAAGRFEDRDVFSAGVNLGFSGFTVGASYIQDDSGRTGSNDYEGFDIGATYGSGPWTVGVTYLHIEQEVGTGLGEDEVDGWIVSGTYNIGPGINLWAGVKYYDIEDSAGAPGSENSATFGHIGTSVSF